MAEGYITRIGRLISASANTLVDSLENVAPQMVMEQTIREIDDAMSDVRQQLGKVEAARYLSTKGLNNDNAKHAELQDQIDVAINAGRDDLAEAAIARQMDIEAMIPVVEKSIADADAEIIELNSYIQALQAKKREMQSMVDEYVKAAKHSAQSGTDSNGAPTSNAADKVENATSAFNRMMNNAGAPGVSSNADAAKLAELETLARNNRIQERLAKAKSEVKP